MVLQVYRDGIAARLCDGRQYLSSRSLQALIGVDELVRRPCNRGDLRSEALVEFVSLILSQVLADHFPLVLQPGVLVEHSLVLRTLGYPYAVE